MDDESRNMLDGMAFAVQSIQAAFIAALVRRGTLDVTTAKELIDSVQVSMQEQRAHMSPAMQKVCDSAVAQLELLLQTVAAQSAGKSP